MNKLPFKGDWNQVKGRLKQAGRLEEKLGVAKDKITRLISEM